MTSRALNGGAINAVSFPGTPAGNQLVEMIGTVRVTGSISVVSLYRLASAAATAYALSYISSTTNRAQLQAVTKPAAQGAVTARSKVYLTPDSLSATCSAVVAAGLNRRLGASTSGSATGVVGGYNYTRRSAAAFPSASSAATARNYVLRTAATIAVASSLAAATRKSTISTGVTAGASSIVAIALAHRMLATTSPAAAGSVTTKVEVQRAAATLARVASVVTAFRALTTAVEGTAKAAVASLFARRGIMFSCAAQAAATTAASMSFKHRMSASVTARAIAVSAAADYSTNQPAPLERQMIVPTGDRRMEVTT